MTQTERINSAMDSQVKRLLAKAIEHEQTKKHFHKMMSCMQAYLDDEQNRQIDTVEEFIQASNHSVSIGGPKYHNWQLEEWLSNELYKIC